ncbi:hypothetical protein BU23DRAFT_563456 [Bimuria novae-zelandiae CBS 107.79]|uniref:Uncharacterized protein n=1 Tax=Bimuria novae-zelandiae CBS 107.79 TaxID=1447943 RepID=A0A6A5VNE6_9PLEO|nr:hypothetical protein BU23DRAFT_563456 [Bimuria novae-zelandiae CBS 107.79]
MQALQRSQSSAPIRGHGLPRSRAMNFSAPRDSNLAVCSTPDPRTSLPCTRPRLSNVKSEESLPRESTWNTASQLSAASNGLPSLPSDFQTWCLSILGFLDQDDFDVSLVSEENSDEVINDINRYRSGVRLEHRSDLGRELGWSSEHGILLPLVEFAMFLKPKISMPTLDFGSIKQHRRNAAIFSLAKAVDPSLFASPAQRTDFSHSSSTSSSIAAKRSSKDTLDSGTSGGYRTEPQTTHTMRKPPHQDLPTIRILEGRGPFVLDEKDISISQVCKGRSGSESTITVPGYRSVQSVLPSCMEVNSAAERQNYRWTSGIISQIEDDIISTLRIMEGDSTAGHLSGRAVGQALSTRANQIDGHAAGRNIDSMQDQGEDNEAVEEEDGSLGSVQPSPPTPAVISTRVHNKKERFGRLGRWLKRKVLRKGSKPAQAS